MKTALVRYRLRMYEMATSLYGNTNLLHGQINQVYVPNSLLHTLNST